MRSTTKWALAAAGGLAAAWVGRSLYRAKTTERVRYATVRTVGGVEIRRYPRTVLAETTAESERAAFRRLFRYITGENRRGDEVAMTAPVRTEGTEIAMTAPVRSSEAGGEVTMAFYLPAEYTPDTAPEPTDSEVSLVVEDTRKLAVKRFSWTATAERVRRHERDLLDAVAAHELQPQGEPFLMRYDAPGTPSVLRTNEVAVEIA
ncbi:SOUL family heme-binding protein [Halostella litorea]|uniref:SOUL family heme-binding protein n=1 Tax=Halostella litorea TaxID=2528831 RepID=UPI0010933687|nr:heme-binding protein [Halostella litorea]